jgi:hypothetical protein
VVRYEKKPTARDALKEREAALGAKDAQGLYELAMWAKEQGLDREWRPLLKKVTRIDRDHAGAREALGYKKLDGRWVSERDYERKIAARREKEYKAKGWKKHDGQWYSPAEYTRIKKGLVKHGEHWVAKDIKKKIDDEGWIFVEGQWVSPEQKEKMDAGYRWYKKRWMLIEDLDEIFSNLADPWVFEGTGVTVRTNAGHQRGVEAWRIAEDAYAHVKELFGEEPDLYGQKGKILINVGDSITDYQNMGKTFPASELSAYQSSKFGVFYAQKTFEDRPGACTYYWNGGDGPEFLRMWVGHGITHSFVNRFREENEANVKLIYALAAYISACHNGKYAPTWWYYSRYINSSSRPFSVASSILGRIDLANEASVAQAGFFLHYLRQRNPEAFAAFWSGFLGGEGDTFSLRKACLPDKDDDAMNADFKTFLQAYKASFKPWDK